MGRFLTEIIAMKWIIVRCAILALLFVFLIEMGAYFNNWRPNFFSFSELGSILTGAIFFTPFIIPIYLAIRKIRKERQVMSLKVRMALGTIAVLIMTAIFYFDEGNGFSGFWDIITILTLFAYSLVLYVLSSVIFLALKERLG